MNNQQGLSFGTERKEFYIPYVMSVEQGLKPENQITWMIKQSTMVDKPEFDRFWQGSEKMGRNGFVEVDPVKRDQFYRKAFDMLVGEIKNCPWNGERITIKITDEEKRMTIFEQLGWSLLDEIVDMSGKGILNGVAEKKR